MPELELIDLTKSYPTPNEPLQVLRGTSLALEAGENAAIVGPSGSGKSTLLHVLGTLETLSGGTYRLGGIEPAKLSEPELAAFRNRKIGFIFQEHHLLPQLTVLENTLIPALASGSPSSELKARAEGLLARVGLAERLTHRPAELSGGERQRAAVARALLLRPTLLLADEPTGSLDRTNALAVAKLLIELQTAERAVLIAVTHSDEIAALFQRRYEIVEGSLQARD